VDYLRTYLTKAPFTLSRYRHLIILSLSVVKEIESNSRIRELMLTEIAGINLGLECQWFR